MDFRFERENRLGGLYVIVRCLIGVSDDVIERVKQNTLYAATNDIQPPGIDWVSELHTVENFLHCDKTKPAI